MRRAVITLFVALLGLVAATVQAAECQVEPFQGAMSSQGAVAHMRTANTARSCAITVYGVPSERANAADSGRITKQPRHGKAEFVAPQAKYRPEPGYVGDDEFEFEAFARSASERQVRLKVRVQVQVVAP
jgi:hypothetical protein